MLNYHISYRGKTIPINWLFHTRFSRAVLSCQTAEVNPTTHLNTLAIFWSLFYKPIAVTYDFIDKIKNKSFLGHVFLHTADTEFLYTNIHTDLGLDEVSKIFQKYPGSKMSRCRMTSVTGNRPDPKRLPNQLRTLFANSQNGTGREVCPTQCQYLHGRLRSHSIWESCNRTYIILQIFGWYFQDLVPQQQHINISSRD